MTTTAQYVTWREGADILEVNRSSFFYFVQTGQIAMEAGRGPRDNRYSLDDINRVAKRRTQKDTPRKGKRRVKPAPVILDWLSPRDIPAILRLDQLVYDEIFLAEMERYRQWSEKNGQLAMAAFDAKSNKEVMLAYIAALPIDESVILDIMRGKREETSITQDEIQTYDRPGAYTLLANSAVAHPDRPDLLYKVLYRMVEEWINRYPEQYVTRIYAQGVSKRGDMLIQHFFMQPRYDLARNAYMLDLSRPGASKLIRLFQDRLKAKAPLPPDLQPTYESSHETPK